VQNDECFAFVANLLVSELVFETAGRCGRGTPAGQRTPAMGYGHVVAKPRAGPRRRLGLDALLADLFGHGLLVGVDVLVQADPLLRHGALLDDRLLGVERDLVLVFCDLRTGRRGVDVVIGDRLGLDADLLALEGDCLLDVLSHDVLAQPRATGLAARRADVELVLPAAIGGRASSPTMLVLAITWWTVTCRALSG